MQWFAPCACGTMIVNLSFTLCHDSGFRRAARPQICRIPSQPKFTRCQVIAVKSESE